MRQPSTNAEDTENKRNIEKRRNVVVKQNANELLLVLKDLVEQIDGIGIPDWNGAEGLSLSDARRLIDRLA